MPSQLWPRAILVAVVALGGSALLAQPALADTPQCVSKSEFRAVHEGWSINRVGNEFDIKGAQDSYTESYQVDGYTLPAEQERHYRACTRYGTAYVTFERTDAGWQVSSKDAYW
jgi:hypothetical protein